VIDVLIPVLGRPENAQKVVSSFRATSGQMDEIHFICSPNDEAEIAACTETGEDVIVTNWKPDHGDYARKMNLGFMLTERPWVFLGSDDIVFYPDWSEAAFAMGGDVIATNDLHNPSVKRGEFGTHCFVRREYVDAFGASADGGFLHTGYDHNFVDRELCGVARNRGVFSFARESKVAHHHPHWRNAPWDSTYKKGLRSYREDYHLFLERAHLWNYAGLSQFERQQARRAKRSKSLS
jgi:hypothetical protein